MIATDRTHTKVIIAGTAPSWQRIPWRDPSFHVVSLNDAYTIAGFQRVDEHYEIHPVHEMWFRPANKREFRIEELPKGKYIRPEGHLEWLKTQAARIPVWLHDDPPHDWPAGAQRFPIEEIEALYGTYWASGPSYMLAHLYERGCREFHIYGIHLATEQEYREQRPNFEALIRGCLGPHVAERRADGLRYYEGRDCLVVLPDESPLLQHGWKYAYEPRPRSPEAFVIARRQEAALTKEHQALARQLISWPRWKSKATALRHLRELQGRIRDCQLQARHALVTAGRV